MKKEAKAEVFFLPLLEVSPPHLCWAKAWLPIYVVAPAEYGTGLLGLQDFTALMIGLALHHVLSFTFSMYWLNCWQDYLSLLGCTKSRYISNSCRWKSFARPPIPATMSSIQKTLYRHPPSSVTEAGGRQSPGEKKAAEVPSPTLSPQVSPFSRGLFANERDVPRGLSPVLLRIFHSPPGDVTQSWGFNHHQ